MARRVYFRQVEHRERPGQVYAALCTVQGISSLWLVWWGYMLGSKHSPVQDLRCMLLGHRRVWRYSLSIYPLIKTTTDKEPSVNLL